MSGEKPLLILYGSQTGTARTIAETLGNDSVEHGWVPRVECMETWLKQEETQDSGGRLAEHAVQVYVVATHGEGEPPDNAYSMWRYLKRKVKDPQHLAGCRYGVLALGSTDHNYFCAFGERLDKRLEALGATRCCAMGKADDATGLAAVVEPWREALWPALEACVCGTSGEGKDKGKGEEEEEEEGEKDKGKGKKKKKKKKEKKVRYPDVPPTLLKIEAGAVVEEAEGSVARMQGRARLHGVVPCEGVVAASSRLLTSADAVKRVYEMSISCPELGGYTPGDAVGVVCPNAPAQVAAVLQHLGISEAEADAAVTVRVSAEAPGGESGLAAHLASALGVTTRRALLTHAVSLQGAPSKGLIRLLAEHTDSEEEREALMHVCSSAGSTAYRDLVMGKRITLCELLAQYPQAAQQVPLAALVSALGPLQPRYYSVTSSPARSQDTVGLCFTEVAYASPVDGQTRHGLCSSWLRDQMASSSVMVFPRPQLSFGLPDAADTAPMLMVCAGAGIAPFLSFLEHLAHDPEHQGTAHDRETWLAFGCRSPDEYLYQDRLEDYQAQGILSRLLVAFSRTGPGGEPGSGEYVQARLEREGDEIRRLLVAEKGRVYVCGDAKGMARGVQQVIDGILEEHGGVALLRQQGRWLCDIW